MCLKINTSILGAIMPSKSEAQHKLMQAVEHSSKFAKKVGIPQKVGREFAEADKKKQQKTK